MIVSPKDNIMYLMEPFLNNSDAPKNEADLMVRIGLVSKILQEFPQLISDKEVYGSLLSATENSVDERIVQFRRSLIVDHYLPIDNKTGKLTLTKDELNQLTHDELWAYIEKHRIENLVISTGADESVIYDKGFLKSLLQNRPRIVELTDMYTLEFEDGIIRVSKAQLRLCGGYFEREFESGMAESRAKTFQFGKRIKEVSVENPNDPEHPNLTTHILPAAISIKGFSDILKAIQTGEYDFSSYSTDFLDAADYLDFYLEIEFPEGIIGKEELEKYLGNVGEVPLPPKQLLDALEAPCPFSNDATIKTKDTHVVMWVPKGPLSPNKVEALINSEKTGVNKIGFDRSQCYFPEGVADEMVEGGYWLLMYKKPLEVTKHMSFKEAEAHIHNHFENYEAPELIDATLCAFMNHVCSGERILNRENPLSLMYTWCKKSGEDPTLGTWHMVVGAFGSRGLCFAFLFDGSVFGVGICPVRKFLGSIAQHPNE